MKLDDVINTRIAFNPMNYLLVWSMLLVGLVAFALVNTWISSNIVLTNPIEPKADTV